MSLFFNFFLNTNFQFVLATEGQISESKQKKVLQSFGEKIKMVMHNRDQNPGNFLLMFTYC